ncbi:sulfate reduction electron transfer complex DsrMKJOP subunit DsrJ, partial [Oceanidesulfovibrio marinus]
MYNAKYTVPAIVVLLILATIPFWWCSILVPDDKTPELALPEDQDKCNEAADYMKANHMQMLNDWRDRVVRQGERLYPAPAGKVSEMSMQNNCMKCHTNKAEFCDQCHYTASGD